MLVWFMHGASVRESGYADPLRSRIISDFLDQGLSSPEFYSSFWGDALGRTDELWGLIQQDLEAFKWEHPQIDLDDVFHYRQRREQLITGFFNDIFSYLNSQQGREVRRLIAVQLLSFLTDTPFEEDLHIVAHSLGSVILWDILFSESFDDTDPAFYIRHAIKGLSGRSEGRKVKLRSVTTFGSPIMIFSQFLRINGDRLKAFASRYTAEPLRWVNVIHASDVFAYPIRASLELEDSTLYFQDHYLGDRSFLKKQLGDVTMALGLVADHSQYWRSSRAARVAIANLLDDRATLEQVSFLDESG
ncbi:MAG: hypothetical protein KME27_18325 [Lyngbya sp. HA4199-MV5]|jgi:hypothetical protein|nr:hypothetical protein [Lyngbya sp. HA4199-MV5]